MSYSLEAGSCVIFCLFVFTAIYPGGPGLAITRMSPFWILLVLKMMEIMTTGAVRRAMFQSNHHHQQTNTQLFTAVLFSINVKIVHFIVFFVLCCCCRKLLQGVQQIGQFSLPAQNDARNHLVCCVHICLCIMSMIFASFAHRDIRMNYVIIRCKQKSSFVFFIRCHSSLLSMKLHLD